MDTVECGVCGQLTPLAFANDHHVRPQAAGGTSVDEQPLCAGCHQNVHATASMLNGPRAAMAEDTVKAFYRSNPKAIQKCMGFAVEVARWMAAKRDGQVSRERPHEDVEVIVVVPAAIKRALTLLGNDARDPATHRKLGMAGAARTILIQHVLQRYPQLRQEIQQSKEKAARSGEGPRGPEPSAAVKRSIKGA